MDQFSTRVKTESTLDQLFSDSNYVKDLTAIH